MKMKELPELDRPYEKLEIFGAETLTMAELLAIIIKTGTKNHTALEVAQELLRNDHEGKELIFLKELSIPELMKTEGIGKVKAIELKAILEIANRIHNPQKVTKRRISSVDDVYRLMAVEYKHREVEVIKTILVDGRNRILKISEVAVGTANYSMVEMKDIFKEPVRIGAVGMILVHNHPSGDPEPSREDISFTKKVDRLAKLFGIHLVDHVIIGDGDYASLKRLKKF